MTQKTRWLVLAALFPLVGPVPVPGAAPAAEDGIQVGRPPIVTSATAACGRWVEKAPLDPETYGKTRGVSPATGREPKILIYTRTLDDDFFRLARVVDSLIARNPGLEWSLVQVIDEKGAQNGSYTAEELAQRLGVIRQLAGEHGVTHLSFLVSAPGAGSIAPRLGLVGGKDVLIAHIDQDKGPHQFAAVRWFDRGTAAALDDAAIRDWAKALQASIDRK